MTKQELMQLLRNKQQECIEVLEEENEELYFFKIFFQRNDFLGFQSIVDTDYAAFLLAYLLMCLENEKDREDAYQYLKEEVISIKEIIDQSPAEGLENLLNLCEHFEESHVLEEARDYFDTSNQKLGKLSLKRIMLERIISDTLGTSSRSSNEERNLGSFINLYIRGEQTFINAIKIIMDMKAFAVEYQGFKFQMDLFDLNSKERKQLQSMFKNSFDLTSFNIEIKKLRTYYEKIVSSDRTKKRNAQKEQKLFETLENTISKAEDGKEIKDIDKTLSKVSDREVQLAILQYVYQHNQKYYQTLINEYEELSKNSTVSYTRILRESGITDIDIETIMHNKVDVVENILLKLKQLNITYPEIIKIILQITDQNTFEEIYNFITQGILSLEFVINNLQIFSKDSQEYKNIIVNMSMFKELGFNPNNLNNSQNVFVEAPNTVSLNIELLRLYGFEKSMKKDIDYSFLSNPDLMNIIDKMLELGLEKFLEEDLSILNYYKNINRLRVIKELNIEVETKEELIDILTTTSFLVPDNMIESYISTQNEDEINIEGIPDDLEVLRDYQKTSRVYDINGVLLSKNRIKRNYHDLEGVENRLAKSIFKGAQISPKDYEIISKTLKESLTQK